MAQLSCENEEGIKITYVPQGVCAKGMNIQLIHDENNILRIKRVKFYGGCPGNATGLAKVLENKAVTEAINDLKGITCGNKPTSCPDQLAQALEDFLNENN